MKKYFKVAKEFIKNNRYIGVEGNNVIKVVVSAPDGSRIIYLYEDKVLYGKTKLELNNNEISELYKFAEKILETEKKNHDKIQLNEFLNLQFKK